MKLETVTAPPREPVTLAELARELRVTNESVYPELEKKIKEARAHFETLLSRAFITQTLRVTWDLDEYLEEYGVYGFIYVPRPPFQSIVSVKTYDADGNETTVAAANYDTSGNDPAKLYPKADGWAPTREFASFVVEFVAGYGTEPSSVDPEVRAAITTRATELYLNRGENVVGTVVGRLSDADASVIHLRDFNGV